MMGINNVRCNHDVCFVITKQLVVVSYIILKGLNYIIRRKLISAMFKKYTFFVITYNMPTQTLTSTMSTRSK